MEVRCPTERGIRPLSVILLLIVAHSLSTAIAIIFGVRFSSLTEENILSLPPLTCRWPFVLRNPEPQGSFHSYNPLSAKSFCISRKQYGNRQDRLLSRSKKIKKKRWKCSLVLSFPKNKTKIRLLGPLHHCTMPFCKIDTIGHWKKKKKKKNLGKKRLKKRACLKPVAQCSRGGIFSVVFLSFSQVLLLMLLLL